MRPSRWREMEKAARIPWDRELARLARCRRSYFPPGFRGTRDRGEGPRAAVLPWHVGREPAGVHGARAAAAGRNEPATRGSAVALWHCPAEGGVRFRLIR